MPWAHSNYPASAVKSPRGKSFGESAHCRRENCPVNTWKSTIQKKNGQYASDKHENSPIDSKKSSREEVFGELSAASRLNCPMPDGSHRRGLFFGESEGLHRGDCPIHPADHMIDRRQAVIATDSRSSEDWIHFISTYFLTLQCEKRIIKQDKVIADMVYTHRKGSKMWWKRKTLTGVA